jgi:hypothetical protein
MPTKSRQTVSEFFAAHPDKLEAFVRDMRGMTSGMKSAIDELAVVIAAETERAKQTADRNGAIIARLKAIHPDS